MTLKIPKKERIIFLGGLLLSRSPTYFKRQNSKKNKIFQSVAYFVVKVRKSQQSQICQSA